MKRRKAETDKYESEAMWCLCDEEPLVSFVFCFVFLVSCVFGFCFAGVFSPSVFLVFFSYLDFEAEFFSSFPF